jgi:hypothetical protein
VANLLGAVARQLPPRRLVVVARDDRRHVDGEPVGDVADTPLAAGERLFPVEPGAATVRLVGQDTRNRPARPRAARGGDAESRQVGDDRSQRQPVGQQSAEDASHDLGFGGVDDEPAGCSRVRRVAERRRGGVDVQAAARLLALAGERAGLNLLLLELGDATHHVQQQATLGGVFRRRRDEFHAGAGLLESLRSHAAWIWSRDSRSGA